jgi:hypothetical protein
MDRHWLAEAETEIASEVGHLSRRTGALTQDAHSRGAHRLKLGALLPDW